MPNMPDIKLTRTKTTHDLSQEAEKRCLAITHVDMKLAPNIRNDEVSEH